ncbi:MAG: EutN/CcmL family microcompartment protein [Bryobacteraceae bacterium]|nr:EutN/CcmL family microcompartment protein [Bryobacteraceae bacterium]
MLIARVVGDLTATQKHPSHEGRKILLVQPLNLDGSDRGAPLVALDSVNAGIHDRVLVTTDGYAAFTAVGHKLAPIDAAVIGIIDHVELAGPASGEAAAPAAAPAAGKKQPKKRQPQNG